MCGQGDDGADISLGGGGGGGWGSYLVLNPCGKHGSDQRLVTVKTFEILESHTHTHTHTHTQSSAACDKELHQSIKLVSPFEFNS